MVDVWNKDSAEGVVLGWRMEGMRWGGSVLYTSAYAFREKTWKNTKTECNMRLRHRFSIHSARLVGKASVYNYARLYYEVGIQFSTPGLRSPRLSLRGMNEGQIVLSDLTCSCLVGWC